MSIVKYDYDIISVDVNSKVMEIIYSAKNHSTFHISARLPYENEDLDDIIKMYAPLVEWELENKNVLPVEKGKGTINLSPGTFYKQDDNGKWIFDESLEKQSLLIELKTIRKEREAEHVLVNNIPYSGDRNNRQSLNEAISFAESVGITKFELWKDSNGNFHSNHPVKDVVKALEKINSRRSALITLEGKYREKIKSGKITSLSKLDWKIG